MHICRSGEIGRRTGLKIQRASRLVSVRLRPSAPLSRISYRVREIKSNSLQLSLQILILSGRGNLLIKLKTQSEKLKTII